MPLPPQAEALGTNIEFQVNPTPDEDEFIIEARTKTIKEKRKDVRLTYNGETNVTEEYWHGVPFRAAEKLPYDIDGKCMYELPINKSRRFESKSINFVGDRYISTWRGSFECHNDSCSHLLEYQGE